MRSSPQGQIAVPATLDQAKSIPFSNLPLGPSDLETLKNAVIARDYARAEELLGEAIKKDPRSNPLLASLGRIFFLDGKYDRSAAELKAADNNGQLAEAERFTLAMAEVVLRRYGEAQIEMESLVQQYPQDSLYHYWLSRVHYAQFHLEAAIAEAKHAIQLDPGFTRGHEHLGLCYEASGENGLAIQSFTEAVRLNQSAKKPSPLPLIDLGALLYKLNRLTEAKTDFRQALNYEPRSSQAHFQLGVLLEKEGEESEAIQQLKQAVSLDPSYAEAHYVLGRALERMGNEDEARAEFASFEKLKKAEPKKQSY